MSTLEKRFWSKVEKGPDCWAWTGSKSEKGYGKINPGGRGGSPLRAHRVSWELEFGSVPDGLHVCHRCDNPTCVNPAHLFLATNEENRLDMARKERSGRAKLSARQVEVARHIRAHTGIPCWKIGELFGVSASAIQDATSGRSWSWLS